MQFLYLAIYWGEMIGKILALGPLQYAKSLGNLMDIFLNIMVLVFAVTVLYSKITSHSRFLRYFILLKLLRVLRLLRQINQYNLIFQTLLSLLPLLGTLFGVMTTIFYIFSLIGVAAFGGKIYQENPDIQGDPALPYAYIYNNFNDFPSGLVTLFELAVVNNWWVIAEMYTKATSVYARLFFVGFYLLAVIVGLNLLVTFVIDRFNTEWEIQKERNKSDAASEFNPLMQRTETPNRSNAVAIFRATLTSSEQYRLWSR